MGKWLYDILKDGTLVDNQVYRVGGGILQNSLLGDIQLHTLAKGKHSRIYNENGVNWQFLHDQVKKINQHTQRTQASGLILFGDEGYEHNWDGPAFTLYGHAWQDFQLQTYNVIGYVKEGDRTLKISSRFGDEFLKHIIADAEGFLRLEDQGGSDTRDQHGYEWLLHYLWKVKLQRAYRLGLPKQYEGRSDRLNRVRGQIDPVAYHTQPRDGKYLCHYREHSYDNPATQLVAAAFRKQEKQPLFEGTAAIKRAFYTATQGKRVPYRQLYQTKPFSNPYYHDYNEVIELSKQILRDEFASFGEQKDSDAFLFDVSMLFEYYIRKLLQRNGITVQAKFDNVPTIPTGTYQRKLEPDLLIQGEKGSYVFDVKYKTFDFRYGVSREDLFQLHTYAGQCGNSCDLQGFGLIYPLAASKWQGYMSNWGGKPYQTERVTLMGKELSFSVFFLVVPDQPEKGQEKDFLVAMREYARAFVDAFKSLSNP